MNFKLLSSKDTLKKTRNQSKERKTYFHYICQTEFLWKIYTELVINKKNRQRKKELVKIFQHLGKRGTPNGQESYDKMFSSIKSSEKDKVIKPLYNTTTYLPEWLKVRRKKKSKGGRERENNK